MKIKIDSNLLLPGLENESEIYFDSQVVTLRMVLEELNKRSSGRIKYISPLTGEVDPVDFIIEINGIPNSGSREELEIGLKDGDNLTIKVSPLGGG